VAENAADAFPPLWVLSSPPIYTYIPLRPPGGDPGVSPNKKKTKNTHALFFKRHCLDILHIQTRFNGIFNLSVIFIEAFEMKPDNIIGSRALFAVSGRFSLFISLENKLAPLIQHR
jgi:hypothetical protein